jgi:hypothetical protein
MMRRDKEWLAKHLLYPAKTLLIWVLVSLALYQTGRLWIVNITGHSFLGYASAFGGEHTISGIARPYRLISGTGDGWFSLRYTRLDTAVAYSEAVLAQLHKNGTFVAERVFDYQALADRPVFIYEYAFDMPAQAFAEAFGWRATLLTHRGISAIRYVAVFPPMSLHDPVRVVFIYGDAMWEYRVTTDLMPTYPIRDENAVPHTLQDGQFVPVQPYAGPRPVQIQNPYANEFGEKHLNFIRTRIAHLFDNPATIHEEIGTGGVYTFSNINTVVRYYGNDILTYASYRTVVGSRDHNLLADYAAAAAFVEADVNMNNHLYLAGFAEQNGRHTFWFNFAVDDRPIPTHDGSHIEVVTERGTVRRYQKLVYNYHTED